MNNKNISDYNPHIDGLRSIAVFSVILFHFFSSIFTGGYLGVDVFFVISGYVITLTIFKRFNQSQKIDLFLFYKKRFFRIFPLLFIVIFTSFFFYLFFGYLFEINYVSKIAISSLLGISNIFYIYLKDDYFLQDELNPYLHTWSLGIEEQFYLIYPLILFFIIHFLFKKKIDNKKITILILIFIFLFISSYLAFVALSDNIYGNFYSPIARFWELYAGCLLFFLVQKYKLRIPRFYDFFIISIFLILIILEYKINNIFFVSLLVVLLSSCLIVLKDGIIYRILQNNFFSYSGKISYSLYLWHLPVLYFSKIYFNFKYNEVASFIVIVLLSILTYHFVENPFRYNKKYQRFFITFVILLGLFFILIIGTLALSKPSNLSFKEQLNKSINSYQLKLKEFNLFEKKYYLSERTNWDINLNGQNINKCENSDTSFINTLDINYKCTKIIDKKEIFILTGDSHGTHYYPMINKSKYVKNFYIQTYNGCFFVKNLISIGKENFRNKDFKYSKNCQKFINSETHKYIQLSKNYKNTFLLISSRYPVYPDVSYITDNQLNLIKDKNRIYELIESNLNKYIAGLSNINIIFIAPLPEFNYYPYSCFLNKKYCYNSKVVDLKRRDKIVTIMEKLSNQYNHVYLFDSYNHICPNVDKCSMYNAFEDILFFKDRDHLTIQGSEFLSKTFDDWLKLNFYKK